MEDKVVISAALAGAATFKEQNPAVPYTPEEFAELGKAALALGFRGVESGPLVRSSYHAHRLAQEVTAR